MRKKNKITESELAGYLAGDVDQDIADKLSYYVKGVLKANERRTTFLQLKSSKYASTVIKMLKDLYGIKGTFDNSKRYPFPTVSFPKDTMVESINEAWSGRVYNPGKRPIVTNKKGEEFILQGFVTSGYYLIPYDGNKYWEHHKVPKSKWIRIDKVNWNDYDYSRKELDKLLKKHSTSIDKINQKFQDINESINEAPTERFLQSAANNLKKQMRGKVYSKADLLHRLNTMPLARMLKPADLEKVADMAMNESINEAKLPDNVRKRAIELVNIMKKKKAGRAYKEAATELVKLALKHKKGVVWGQMTPYKAQQALDLVDEQKLNEEIGPEDYVEIRQLIRQEIASVFFDLFKKRATWK